MDPTLKALCIEVLGESINSERFAWLLIETGVNVEGYEFNVANGLLRQGDALAYLAQSAEATVQ